MNEEAVSQLFFDERYTVPSEQTARRLFEALPHAHAYAATLVDAMATGCLVALLESMCLAALQPYVDHDADVVVGIHVDCRHCAPIPAGASIRVTGWVQGIGDREVTFRVEAQDEQEQVCDGSVRLAIVPRAYMDRVMSHKCGALARRDLFTAA